MNVAQLQRDFDAKKAQASALLEKTMKLAQDHTEEVDGKKVTGRLFTAEETADIKKLITEGEAIKARLLAAQSDTDLALAIERLTADVKVTAPQAAAPGHRSLGQQWIESPAGQYFLKRLHRGSRQWNAPIAELFGATLTTGPASGGPLVITDYQPTILPILYKRLTIRDLLAPGTTDSNSITYMKETAFTNAAAAVAEGAAKPESTLTFAQVVDLVQKIAHWLPVSEEMLEDVAQIRSYIDARLRLGVELTEEDQLLNGDGTAPNISGIRDRAGLTVAHARVDPETNIDAIFIQTMAIFNASFVMPDAHVLNPANWSKIQLAKDTQGHYLGTGPFAAPNAATLWGLPVAVTPSMPAGTSLTGSFKSSAQIFDHGQLRVEASNSHQDFFTKNLVAIRAERRLALAVYRPGAFGECTGLN